MVAMRGSAAGGTAAGEARADGSHRRPSHGAAPNRGVGLPEKDTERDEAGPGQRVREQPPLGPSLGCAAGGFTAGSGWRGPHVPGSPRTGCSSLPDALGRAGRAGRRDDPAAGRGAGLPAPGTAAAAGAGARRSQKAGRDRAAPELLLTDRRAPAAAGV